MLSFLCPPVAAIRVVCCAVCLSYNLRLLRKSLVPGPPIFLVPASGSDQEAGLSLQRAKGAALLGSAPPVLTKGLGPRTSCSLAISATPQAVMTLSGGTEVERWFVFNIVLQ